MDEAWTTLSMSPSGCQAISISQRNCVYHNLREGLTERLEFYPFWYRSVEWCGDEMAVIHDGHRCAYLLKLREGGLTLHTIPATNFVAFTDGPQLLTWNFSRHIERWSLQDNLTKVAVQELGFYKRFALGGRLPGALLVQKRLIAFKGCESRIWDLEREQGCAPLIDSRSLDPNLEIVDARAIENHILFVLNSGDAWHHDVVEGTWQLFQVAPSHLSVGEYRLAGMALNEGSLVFAIHRRPTLIIGRWNRREGLAHRSVAAEACILSPDGAKVALKSGNNLELRDSSTWCELQRKVLTQGKGHAYDDVRLVSSSDFRHFAFWDPGSSGSPIECDMGSC